MGSWENDVTQAILLCALWRPSHKGKCARFYRHITLNKSNEGIHLWNWDFQMLGIINQTSSKMPASLFEMNANQNLQEEQRALQLALELSVLGLNSDEDAQTLASSATDLESRRKSANTTECVPVPSSEHVAEIVGRQGLFIIYFIHSKFTSRPRGSVFIGHAQWLSLRYTWFASQNKDFFLL